MKKIIYLLSLPFLFSGCFQQEESPEKLIYGRYVLNDNESILLINDSILIMQTNTNNSLEIDTIKYNYSPPLKDENSVASGSVFLNSAINQNSELYKYCLNMNLDNSHLFYTKRYGQYMLLPNPESTDFSFVLKLED